MKLTDVMSKIYVTQHIEVSTSTEKIYLGLCGDVDLSKFENINVSLLVATSDGTIRIFVE